MNRLRAYVQELHHAARDGWNRFWFQPEDPATLGCIRIATGAMLFYTHLVWSLELNAFLGAEGRLTHTFVQAAHGSVFGWSHLYGIESPTWLWVWHAAALVVFALLTVGWWTRVVAIVACLLTISYAHRGLGALFGLDQINILLAMYLAVGPSGQAYSVDAWLRRRRGKPVRPTVSARIAIRLIQVHMCIVYLFAGLGKLLGDSWWEGTAMWLALANYEYQTLDMTWLGQWPLVINAITFMVLAWEVSYVVLIWSRWTRPIMLALAIPVHLGIAVCMGMITFGLIMLVGNMAFVPAEVTREVLGGRSAGEGQGGRAAGEFASAPEKGEQEKARRVLS